MRRLLSLLLSRFSLLLILAGPAAAADVPQIRYDKTTLPNGLEVILVEDHRLPIVAVNIWYHVGPASQSVPAAPSAKTMVGLRFTGPSRAGDWRAGGTA
ncbi:hypothetical protein GCM10025794_28050 [Massilia kyonggiensis]